jgi:hypothetical protein
MQIALLVANSTRRPHPPSIRRNPYAKTRIDADRQLVPGPDHYLTKGTLLEGELTLEGIANEFRLGPHAQLSHEVRPMRLHGSDTD